MCADDNVSDASLTCEKTESLGSGFGFRVETDEDVRVEWARG